MRKIGFVLIGLSALLIIYKMIGVVHGCPEKVLDIVKHWSIAWLKGGVIALIVGIVIFAINKYLNDERTMSIVGIFTLPILIPTLLYFFYGESTLLLWTGAISGAILGYFSYIVDDHLLDAWRVRHITLPILIGLGFGGSVIVAAVVENWQDDNLYVSEHAACTEITVKRYTYHYRSSKNGGPYHSWDTHKMYYVFVYDSKCPNPRLGIDYRLGTGAWGKTDRAEFACHSWVGGEKLTKNGESKGAKWIYLTDNNFAFKDSVIYEIEENFFGQAIKEGKVRDDIPYSRTTTPQTLALPTQEDVPDTFSMSFKFFSIMATNPDFGLLRWIYLLLYLPFILGAIFISELRISFFLFFISSTIIILIILTLILARSRDAWDAITDRFKGYGGGSSGGAGGGGSW